MSPSDALAAARAACAAHAWGDAREALLAVDREEALGSADLERLAIAAWLTGHADDAVAALERLHHRLADRGDVAGAAGWAVWLAILHFQQGATAQGRGWVARADRLLDDVDDDCPERGLVMIPGALQALGNGDAADALATFRDVATIAERFAHRDLTVMALLGRGQALVAMGHVESGLALLDETMVEVTTGDVLPVLAGIAYCAVIIACRDVFDLRRAQEWTAVLSRWCTHQQDLKPFRGQCLVHRSEIMQLRGDWSAALGEVETACAHLAALAGDPALGMAQYQRAELLRLRGDLEGAEEAYRRSGQWGHTVQPGLALLRLAQGRPEDAAAAIRRVIAETEGDRVRRAAVLAAHVEIMLAVDDLAEARSGVDELEGIAADFDSLYLEAQAAGSRGAVCLADDEAAPALVALRRAWQAWQRLDAPYEAACVRLLMARALRAVGDDDTADMEVDAARHVFEELGAAPAIDEAARLVRTPGEAAPGGLTPREVEVLRLVATGATNRAVADELVISEKTVARHLSNMFTKLDLTSRSAATAWAYEHHVV